MLVCHIIVDEGVPLDIVDCRHPLKRRRRTRRKTLDRRNHPMPSRPCCLSNLGWVASCLLVRLCTPSSALRMLARRTSLCEQWMPHSVTLRTSITSSRMWVYHAYHDIIFVFIMFEESSSGVGEPPLWVGEFPVVVHRSAVPQDSGGIPPGVFWVLICPQRQLQWTPIRPRYHPQLWRRRELMTLLTGWQLLLLLLLLLCRLDHPYTGCISESLGVGLFSWPCYHFVGWQDIPGCGI